MILSIIVPAFNEKESLPHVVSALNDLFSVDPYLKLVCTRCYLIIVDDGSNDGSWDLIKTFSSPHFSIKGIKLSRNFGHQSALLTGLDHAVKCSDANICIDADLQHDISLIPLFIKSHLNGNDIVLGIKKDRGDEPLLKKIFSIMFYRFMKIMGVNINYNHADFRLLSSRATLELLKFTEKNLFIRGLIPILGFRTDKVIYDVNDRQFGSSKYNIYKMISLALKGVTAFSVVPLRIISVLGLLCFLFSMIMSGYVIYTYLRFSVVPGWASILLPIYFLGGIQIFSIGIIGEYLGRIYFEVKSRPLYIVEEEF